MSERDAQATQADASADDQSQADTIGDESQADASHDDTISRAEAKKLRSEAANLRQRLKEAEGKAQEAERKQKEREDAEAKKRGEWEKIAAKREQELNDLRTELAERDRQALRASIARKHRLPDDALEFVTGDDEDAIEASVKKLAKITARTEDVDTDSGKRSSTTKQTTKPGSLLASYTFGKRA